MVCASLTRASGREDRSRADLVPGSANVRRVETRWVLSRDPHTPPINGPSISGAWWKARAYAEWLFLTRDWSWHWGEAALREAASTTGPGDYDVLVLDGPPFPPVVPFVRWAIEEGVPIVLDLRDVWGWEDESFPAWSFLSPRLRRRRWNVLLRDEAVRSAAHVVLTSHEMVEVMLERYPDLPSRSFSCVHNAYESVDAVPEGGSGSSVLDRLRVVYTGSLAYGRLTQAVNLLRGMEEYGRRGIGNVELVLAGKGAEKVVTASASQGLSNLVESLGWLDRDEAVRVQQEAGALLLLQPSTDLGTRVAIPAKLFEYMARRRPILGMVGTGVAGRIIREHDLGVVVDHEDPGSLADALVSLSRRIAREPHLPPPPDEFAERSTVARFAHILDEVLARSKGRGA